MNDETTQVCSMTEEQQTNVPVVVNTNDDCDSILPDLDLIQTQIDGFLRDLKTMSVELKNTKKKYVKVMKSLTKTKRRRVVNDENGDVVKKEPSGFVTPIQLSEELADFMGVPFGTKLPRTVVTKRIISFIKENHLESATNGRNFDLSDDTNPKAVQLKTLFGINKGDEVNYFNLQSHLKKHFIQNKNKEAKESGDSTLSETNENGEPVSKKLRIKKSKVSV